MNNITITGQLGRDAEIRSIPSGDQVLSFSVADSQGRDKPTIWWNCQMWGKRAGSISQYMTKGQSVAVSGSLSEREWTDKQGEKRKTLEIRVTDVALMGGKRESNEGQAAAPRQKAPAQGGSGFDDMDDEIPF